MRSFLPEGIELLQKTAERGVGVVPPGSIVTTPRTDVQHVVTEYGCVDLMFSSVPDRVKKLISIAHSDFREALTREAAEAGLLY